MANCVLALLLKDSLVEWYLYFRITPLRYYEIPHNLVYWTSSLSHGVSKFVSKLYSVMFVVTEIVATSLPRTMAYRVIP